MALKAQLIMVNMPAKNAKNTSAFYSALLGIEFAPAWSDEVEGYHAPVSIDGMKLSVQTPGQGQQGPACIFAVENLQNAILEVEKLGGRALGVEFAMPIAKSAQNAYAACAARYGAAAEMKAGGPPTSIGNAAVVKDPAGNSLVLVQLESHANYSFHSGPLYKGLTVRQIQLHEEELAASKSLHLKHVK